MLADNYVTFGVMLAQYLLIPVVLAFGRGVPAWARGAGAAAVAMIAVIFASLALGWRSLELYYAAVYFSLGAAIVAALPYSRREPYLHSALLIALIAIMGALNLLFTRIFFGTS